MLKEKLYSSKESVLKITTGLDKDMQIEIGTCLRIFRHLVARKEVILDITQKIDLNKSAQSLVTVIMDKREKERIA